MKNRFESENDFELEEDSIDSAVKKIESSESSPAEKVSMLDKLIMECAMREKNRIALDDFHDVEEFSVEDVSRRADKLEEIMSDTKSEIGRAIEMRNNLMRQIEGAGVSGEEVVDELVKKQEANRLAMLEADLEASLEKYRRIKGVGSDDTTQDFESSIQAVKDQEDLLRGEE